MTNILKKKNNKKETAVIEKEGMTCGASSNFLLRVFEKRFAKPIYHYHTMVCRKKHGFNT